MAFLRPTLVQESVPHVRGDGLFLRAPVLGDYEAWASLRAQSQSHLVPFEPTWAADELTRSAFRERLRIYNRNQREGTAYALFIFREQDQRLIGALTLANVRRGVTQAATVGYWMGQPFTRAGNMTRALVAVLPFVFETLRLHRLEAACLPRNAASIRVLERAGFVREGLARRYLRINGEWEDHLLYALLAEDWAR